MNFKRVISPAFWADVVSELYWRATADPSAPIRTGNLPALDGVSIRWPKEYSWKPAEKWLTPLRKGFEELVPVALDSGLEDREGAVMMEVAANGESIPVAIDYSDYPKLNQRFVEHSKLYFKMQFDSKGYPHPHVIPGGFVANDMAVYSYLPRLQRVQRETPALYSVYGRFGASFAQEVRTKALNILKSQDRFPFEGSMKIIRYSRFLKEVALSKVCINLPGNGDLCFRLFDYLAVGACVVSPPLNTTLPVPLEDRKHIAYVMPDMSDLVEVCEHYLNNEDERRVLQQNAREYFLRNIHYQALSRYYLWNCLNLPAE